MQFSMFDGKQEFRFKKPIRLIEFFAGYGSQALALNELGVKYEHWKICEWAVKSIQAYKDNHFYHCDTDWSNRYTTEYIFNYLAERGISSNYNEPMTLEQIKRLGEAECRKIFNNITTTNNLVDISKAKGKDLEITETDKYDYILTYSFPCQDLSKAGKGKGMARDSGTRSGLLWEVERILDECAELGSLPQILLMENVPDVIGTKNLPHFRNWRDKLESLGYKCYWKVLNAKDFGIPQNRERCFMVSILGDYFFSFPQEINLPFKLLDVLETNVDEKYYLSQKAIKGKLETKFRVSSFEGCLPQEDGCCRTLCARDYKDPKCIVEITEPIACELRCDEGIRTFKDNIMGTLRTIDGCGDKHIIEPSLKEQLCDKLVESGLLKVGTVINHSYTNGLNGKNPNSRQTLEDYIESENGICNCLTTRPDVLGIAVEDLTTKNKRLASMVDKIDPTKTQAIDMYNQSVHDEMHTIKTNVDKVNMTAITQNLRIRKLTPRECFRLMGVRDVDFENIEKNQSRASLYHLAGDSIVVAVLVAILSHFVDGFDFNKYIESFYKQIREKNYE